MTPSATAEVVHTAASLWLQRTRQQRACGTRAASSSSCSPREVSRGQPMLLEAHGVAQHMVDGLRATGSIISQRPAATGWSADLTTAPTCTAEEPMQTSQHCKQTGCRSSPACRSESCAACSTLHSMSATTSEPLSLSARPHEVCRAREWARQRHRCLRQSSFRN